MYTKSTSSLALWSTKPSSSPMKLSNSTIRQPNNTPSRKSSSNSELVSDLPDLSHLSEDERKIIEAVLERQKAEEAKDLTLAQHSVKNNQNQNFSSVTSSNNSISNTHLNQDKTRLTNFNSSQRHSISDIAEEVKQRYGSIDTGNFCDLCKKTKFTNPSVDRVCFNCKSRCCVRCSIKYSTKTKQIWMCFGCKKKQDEFLRSPILNKKNYASDYILNKTQTSVTNSVNETGQTNQMIPKRQLPNISKIKQQSQDETVSNLRTDEKKIIFSNTTNDTDNNQNLSRKASRPKMALIKQASLNNPPSYFSNLNDCAEYDSGSFLKNSDNISQQNKRASSQELRKYSFNSNDFYSSPGSSASQLNFGRSRSKAERLQDPGLLYKASKNPSRKNSTSNLNEVSNFDTDETSMYEREKSLNILLKGKQVNRNETSNDNAINRPVLEQRKNDETQNSLEEIQTKLDELNSSAIRKQSSKKKRKTRQQPALPILPVDTNPTLIKKKLLAEISKKQNSFYYSDDENQKEDFELINIGQNMVKDKEQNSQENEADDAEEEEEENEEFDIEDDIHSNTEYTTNDEMDLESASLAANQLNTIRSGDSNLINRRASLSGMHHSSLDDYLLQNLRKEEIFAHKINKFLSPSDWKLSSDGKKMIGHVLLKKTMLTNTNSVVNSSSSSTIDSATDFNLSLSFGMKVIGGRLNPITNQLSAYVVKVKKDSIADIIGRLQVDDEIVKWNGKLLRGLSFDEVYSIINKSKQDSQIELIVERVLNLNQNYKLDNLHDTESNISLKNDDVFNISAPLAVFNSSICSHNPNDSNNNNFNWENQNIYENIDDFCDEDILCTYKLNKLNDSCLKNQIKINRLKFLWKKVLICVFFIKSLELSRKNIKFKVPLIKITSSSTLKQTNIHENQKSTPDMKILIKKSNETSAPTYETKSASIFFNSNPLILNFNSPKKKTFYQRKGNVVNFEGSFIIYDNIGSATSFINTPKMYSIDLKTPKSIVSDSPNINYKEQNNYYKRKTEMRSLEKSNQLTTPLLIKNLNNKSLEIHQEQDNLIRDRKKILSSDLNVIKPAFSYSSIPYIDQEELDNLIKQEYNIQVINLNEIEENTNERQNQCQSCLENIFFVLKSITTTIHVYLVPSSEEKKKS